MAYIIKLIEEDRFVFLSYEGNLPPRDIAAALYEANGLLNGRRWNRMMVDCTRLESVPTVAQLLDFVKGVAGQVPAKTLLALVVRAEQERHARLIEKIARKDGVFVAYFIDSGKATLWIQRSQPFRRKLGRTQRCLCGEPKDPFHFCSRRCIASSGLTPGTVNATVAEHQITKEKANEYERHLN